MTAYSAWPLDKMKKELIKLEKAINVRESLEKKQVVAEIKAVAKKHGFTLSDLLKEPASTSASKSTKLAKTQDAHKKAKRVSSSKGTKPKRRAKAKIKFRNPGNRNETWTGRGRQPRWVAEFVSRGGELSQLTV